MDINKTMHNKVDSLGLSNISTLKVTADHHERVKEDLNSNINLTKDNINNLIATLNSAAKSTNQKVSFFFNEKANRVIIKITDPKTSEIIKEVPPKEMIKLLEHIHDFIGIIFDKSI